MNVYLHLALLAALPIIAAVLLYIADKKTAFGKLNYWIKQAVFGIVFGGLAVISTEFGADVGGAVANVRDASVLTAGLLFGAPAGIIAGVIGGAERWLASLWGAGTYTRLACTLSTMLAGVIGATLRKHMFDNKKPSCGYALCIGLVTEVMHMLMIFVTHMNDIETAFSFVKICSVPMITLNGLCVMLAVLFVSLIGKERASKESGGGKHISTLFQRWLLVCVVIALLVTGAFTAVLQNNISDNDTDNQLALNLEDVKADISDASDENLLALTRKVADDLVVRSKITNDTLTVLAAKYGISEIDLIDENGLISASTNESFVGYDMSSGEQSQEFLVLLDGTDEYVQDYQAISYDESIFRKYAGVALTTGGFVQVGYDAASFQEDISETVVGLTRNRRIGKTGCVLIVDRDMNVISARDDYEGLIIEDTELPSAVEEGERFTLTVYGKKSYCMYGVNEGYIIIAAIPVSEALFSRDISVYVMLFMEIIIFACLFALIYFLVKSLVVDNIRRINGTLAKITGGNLDVSVDVRTNEEFSSLSDDINATVVTLKRYIAEAAARIDKELEFARAIQHSALPSVFPPFPNRTDFDIYACMDAAKEVGGDFYDFYLTDQNSLVFLVADVSGKGIPAAMFMMRAKTLIKGYAEAGRSVEEVLTLANDKLCEGNDAEMFVTAWMGKLDLATGELSFANAGHNPPLFRHAGGEYEYLRSRAGFVLGGMEGVKYRRNELKFAPGDSIFIYTDGVTEATSADVELYGEERLEKALNSTRGLTPQAVCEAAKEDVDAFVGEAPQFDDITMLSLCYKGGEAKVKELTVDATLENIEKITEFADSQLEELGCPVKAQTQFDIAIDEIVSNIARYAYAPEVGKVSVSIEVNESPLSVVISFMDGGVPFDPLNNADPDVTQSADDRQIGGLGIYMVKKSMDDVRYEHRDGKNVLTIRKNIEK